MYMKTWIVLAVFLAAIAFAMSEPVPVKADSEVLANTGLQNRDKRFILLKKFLAKKALLAGAIGAIGYGLSRSRLVLYFFLLHIIRIPIPKTDVGTDVGSDPKNRRDFCFQQTKKKT